MLKLWFCRTHYTWCKNMFEFISFVETRRKTQLTTSVPVFTPAFIAIALELSFNYFFVTIIKPPLISTNVFRQSSETVITEKIQYKNEIEFDHANFQAYSFQDVVQLVLHSFPPWILYSVLPTAVLVCIFFFSIHFQMFILFWVNV